VLQVQERVASGSLVALSEGEIEPGGGVNEAHVAVALRDVAQQQSGAGVEFLGEQPDVV
jgi:hypothetical protein